MGQSYSINNPEGVYFITFATVEWVDVFTRKRYVEIVIDSLKYCQEKKGLNIHGWCLMSNHIHLIVSALHPEVNNLSGIIRDFKKFTSNKIIDSIQNESGESRRNWMLWIFGEAGKKNSNNKNYQFWQQENHPEELITNKFIEQKIEYIHNNPVEAGLVENPEDYMYSSARNYSGKEGLIDVEFLD